VIDAAQPTHVPATRAPLEVEAAPSWRRACALGIDLLPILTLWLLATLAISAGSAEPAPETRWNLLDTLVDTIHARPTVVALSGVSFALLLFAWPLALHLLRGATPGRRVMGLTLVTRGGAAPEVGRLAAHCALRVVGLLFFAVGALWALADPARRTLYDRAAAVWVVRRRAP